MNGHKKEDSKKIQVVKEAPGGPPTPEGVPGKTQTPIWNKRFRKKKNHGEEGDSITSLLVVKKKKSRLHFNYFKATANCRDGFSLFKAILYAILGSNYHYVGADVEHPALNLGVESVVVGPNLEEVSQVFAVLWGEVIKQNNLFAIISVPPFGHPL